MTTSIACMGSYRREATWLHLAAFTAFLLMAAPNLPLLAQGLDAEGAVESIIGSEVQTEEQAATAAQSDKVLTAIASASEAAMEARMAFSLDGVKIIFIPEADKEDSSISEAVQEHQAAIKSLRQAVQGNAMLFHSIDSHSIQLDNILAIDFGEDGTATIYVAGKDPSQ